MGNADISVLNYPYRFAFDIGKGNGKKSFLGIFNVRNKFTRKSQFPDSVFQIFWWIFRFEMSLAVLNCFPTFRQDAMNRDDGKLRLNSFKHPQSSTKIQSSKRSCWHLFNIYFYFYILRQTSHRHVLVELFTIKTSDSSKLGCKIIDFFFLLLKKPHKHSRNFFHLFQHLLILSINTIVFRVWLIMCRMRGIWIKLLIKSTLNVVNFSKTDKKIL